MSRSTAQAPVYLQRHWERSFANLFDRESRSAVVKWLSESGSQRRVIVVGSGFTRNAENGRNVPTWKEQRNALLKRSNLGISIDASGLDTLELFDLFESRMGKKKLRNLLLSQLDDESLRPREAHDALWASNPAAVVTTNYLDTLLEKSLPKRSRRIVNDADLRCPHGEEFLIPLVYFHGHRDSPVTWIAGRTQYERLPNDKPLLLAKVRQLLSEHPSLLVGYSLTDPDFHEIYRDVSQWMSGKGPPGLALMLYPGQDGAKNAAKLRRQYWRRLNLEIAWFSERLPCDLDKAHAKFFELTAKLDSYDQLSATLVDAYSDLSAAKALRENMRTAASALTNLRAHEIPPLDTDRACQSLWRDVLRLSVPRKRRRTAQLQAQQSNLAETAQHRASSGEKIAPSKLEVPALKLENWVRGARPWKSHARLTVEGLRRGSEQIQQIEQLLEIPGTREPIREWLARALDENLVYFDHDRHALLLAAGLLTEGERRRLQEWSNRAREHQTLRNQLKAPRPSARKPTPVPATTKLMSVAQKQLLKGDKTGAALSYRAAFHALRDQPETAPDAQLQGYFAALGELECLAWDSPRELLTQAQKLARTQREPKHVRRWLDQIKSLSASTRELSAKSGATGYERTSFSVSSSPEALRHEFVRARRLGAPPGWLRENLLAPLEGLFLSDKEELELRLTFGSKNTGTWVADAVAAGEFAAKPPDHALDIRPLGTKERVQSHTVVSAILTRQRSSLPPQTVDAIGKSAKLLIKSDVASALAVVSKLEVERYDCTKLEALSRIARVTSWSNVRGHLQKAVKEKLNGKPRSLLDLNRGLRSLPWEHWVHCDNFIVRGGREFVELACHPAPRGWSEYTAWSLHALCELTSGDTAIEAVACSWLNAHRSRFENGEDLDGALALLGILRGRRPCLRIVEEILKERDERRPYPELARLLIAASSKRSSNLQDWASSRLMEWVERSGWKAPRRSRSFGTADENTEGQVLVWAMRNGTSALTSCTKRLLELSERTWDVLSELAPVLSPEYWQGRWTELVELLLTGGHRRDPKSWQLARLTLLSSVELEKGFVLPPELGFLIQSATESIGHGDSTLANRAAYSLAAIGPYVRDEQSQFAIASAIRGAADDIRIDVAHGAAFAAGYLSGVQPRSHVPTLLSECANKLRTMFATDPSALIQRQLVFGRAKAKFLSAQDPAVFPHDPPPRPRRSPNRPHPG